MIEDHASEEKATAGNIVKTSGIEVTPWKAGGSESYCVVHDHASEEKATAGNIVDNSGILSLLWRGGYCGEAERKPELLWDPRPCIGREGDCRKHRG